MDAVGSPTDRVTVGIDLGTSGVRALAIDGSGSVRARSRHATTTSRPEAGAAEQSVDDWWDAAGSAIEDVASVVPGDRWNAIGLSAMLPTLVVRDRAGRVRLPAITWEDGRAEPFGQDFVRRVGERRLRERTGQRVDGRYLLPMACRLRSQGLITDSDVITGAKDHLFAELTGVLLTDPSTASGYGAFDLETGAWDRRMIAEAGAARVPPVAPSTSSEPLRDELADRWGLPRRIPVVLGAADSVLAAYALGATGHGSVSYIAGTSTAILRNTRGLPARSAACCLITPSVPAGFDVEADLLATGAAFDWLAGVLGVDGPAELLHMASTASPGSVDILPFVAPGEQGVLWRPDLSGVIAGLTLTTTRAQIARALETAVILESNRCIRAISQILGPTTEIVATGSSASSAEFRQDLADATGCLVRYNDGEADHSAIGAATLAMHATTGRRPAEQTLADTCRPDRSVMAIWDGLAKRHDAIMEKMFPTNTA